MMMTARFRIRTALRYWRARAGQRHDKLTQQPFTQRHCEVLR